MARGQPSGRVVVEVPFTASGDSPNGGTGGVGDEEPFRQQEIHNQRRIVAVPIPRPAVTLVMSLPMSGPLDGLDLYLLSSLPMVSPLAPSPDGLSSGQADSGRATHRRRSIIIVVVVVVISIAGLIALGSSSSSNTTATTTTSQTSPGVAHLEMGQRADLSASAQDDGIVSVTVYSLKLPYASTTSNQPVTGDVFALGDVEACAGSQGANTDSGNALLAFQLSLVMPDGNTLGMEYQNDAEEPSLANLAGHLGANKCARGSVTFQVPTGQVPVAVGWGPPDTPQYEWANTPS